MKTNHRLTAMLCACTFTVASFSIVSAYPDEPAKAEHSHKSDKPDEARIKAAITKLPEPDRAAATAQRYCAVMDTARLGTMGVPLKVVIDGKPVFVCCSECKGEATEHGKKTLAKAEKLKKAAAAVAKLPAADQPLAEAQLLCPIDEGSRLGSMGTPVKLLLDGKPVFLCCKGCEDAARENSKTTLAKVEQIKKENQQAAHHDHDHDHAHDGDAGTAGNKGSPRKIRPQYS